ncbi:hypothetical protein PR048_001740 [Dryococelus australis]|uniref:Uncharacterized protein n=1 Tax=Dryococelus australis TaxID=614101 RepID=A0ABQ9IID1_9NEOP|nr:hypothetical protein PR048_001740 [Dryococelus australis]
MIPEKIRQSTASSGTIPTCENPVTRPEIEPGSPWWEASMLTTQPPSSLDIIHLLFYLTATWTGVSESPSPPIQRRLIGLSQLVPFTTAGRSPGTWLKTRVRFHTASVALPGRRCHVIRRLPHHHPGPWWLGCSPPTGANRVHSTAWSLPDFRKCASCRTMPLVGGFFLGDLPFPLRLHSGAAPFSSHFTYFGSQDLFVNSCPNFSTQFRRRSWHSFVNETTRKSNMAGKIALPPARCAGAASRAESMQHTITIRNYSTCVPRAVLREEHTLQPRAVRPRPQPTWFNPLMSVLVVTAESPLGTRTVVRLEHCTSVQSLALIGYGKLVACASVDLIGPALLGLQAGGFLELKRELEIYLWSLLRCIGNGRGRPLEVFANEATFCGKPTVADQPTNHSSRPGMLDGNAEVLVLISQETATLEGLSNLEGLCDGSFDVDVSGGRIRVLGHNYSKCRRVHLAVVPPTPSRHPGTRCRWRPTGTSREVLCDDFHPSYPTPSPYSRGIEGSGDIIFQNGGDAIPLPLSHLPQCMINCSNESNYTCCLVGSYRHMRRMEGVVRACLVGSYRHMRRMEGVVRACLVGSYRHMRRMEGVARACLVGSWRQYEEGDTPKGLLQRVRRSSTCTNVYSTPDVFSRKAPNCGVATVLAILAGSQSVAASRSGFVEGKRYEKLFSAAFRRTVCETHNKLASTCERRCSSHYQLRSADHLQRRNMNLSRKLKPHTTAN